MIKEACPRRDLVQNRISMALLWILPVAIIVVTGNLFRDGWIVTTAWTASLMFMGTACLVNACGCGRMHCFFTGPFFLIMAVLSFMYGAQLLPLGAHGWQYIGATLLSGGVLLCVVPERIWGRYRPAKTESHEC